MACSIVDVDDENGFIHWEWTAKGVHVTKVFAMFSGQRKAVESVWDMQLWTATTDGGSQPAKVEVKLRSDRPISRYLASLAFGGTGSNEVDEWRFED